MACDEPPCIGLRAHLTGGYQPHSLGNTKVVQLAPVADHSDARSPQSIMSPASPLRGRRRGVELSQANTLCSLHKYNWLIFHQTFLCRCVTDQHINAEASDQLLEERKHDFALRRRFYVVEEIDCMIASRTIGRCLIVGNSVSGSHC
jgi:hypothetical protein